VRAQKESKQGADYEIYADPKRRGWQFLASDHLGPSLGLRRQHGDPRPDSRTPDESNMAA
jgi:hypothetical protein